MAATEPGTAGLPSIRLRHCERDGREPGAMLFNVRAGGVPGTSQGVAGWLVALDRAGRCATIYKAEQAVQGVRLLANGNLLVSIMDGLILELTFVGAVARRWYATGRFKDRAPPEGGIPVDAQTFHHGVNLTADGNMLLLSMEVRELDRWPSSTTDDAAPRERARVVGDIIMEVRPDGTKVREFRLLDILDPYRITYGSRSHYWWRRGFPDTCDWCHANGTFHDTRDDSILVSLRTQDCMIKLDRRSGELKWILGSHHGWRDGWSSKLLTSAEPILWNFHQHDPSITPSGTVMCFDNGNHRAVPFAPPIPHSENYSRAVEFAVDEQRGTVRQVWTYGDGGGERLFAGFQGGALRLPTTGNTFITYGGICSIDGQPVDEPDGAETRARLVEVTDDKRIVLDVEIGGREGDSRQLSVFRSTHIPFVPDLDWR